MASFTLTWDATYESLPPDTGEAASLGASRIRDDKKAVRERLAIDHFLDGDAHDGKHNKVTLKLRASDPTLETDDSALYTKTVSSTTELFYKDNDGVVFQLTRKGAIESFPSGTKMLFPQSSAPVGWTIDTTHNNKAMRLVSSGGGSTGGSVNFSTVFSATRVTTSTGAHTHTITVDNHVLTTPEIPVHNHFSVSLGTNDGPVSTLRFTRDNRTGSGDTDYALRGSDTTATVSPVSSTGSSNGHNHTGSSGSAGGHTHTTNLDVQFVDILICTKD